MRKLPEHSPKSDLWSKIQAQKDFDAQVKAHASNLPLKEPKADLWSAIESELDQKTPVIPLWKYGVVAASLVLILAISGIAYLEVGTKDMREPVITEKITTTPELPTSKESKDTGDNSTTVPQIQSQLAENHIPQNQPIKKETIAPVGIPKLELADLIIENPVVPHLEITKTPEMEGPKTLHKVRISWGLKEQPKFKTTLGLGIPEDISERQIGRANQNSSSIKIKIKRE